MTVEPQDPQSTLDWSVDWSSWLADGDSVSTSSWSIVPTGPTLSGETLASSKASVKVSGLAANSVYRLTNQITTAGGLTHEQSWTLRGMHQ